MKHSLMILLLFQFVLSVNTQDNILIEAETSIHAGEAWSIIITVDNQIESVDVTLLSGISRFDQNFIPRDGEQVVWAFEEGQLTQAGTTLILIRAEDQVVTYTLEIRPLKPEQIDLFATSNAIEAYGQGATQLISFLYDVYGNAIDDYSATLNIQSPDGKSVTTKQATYNDGLANITIESMGKPGILRTVIETQDLFNHLQILQFPSKPHTLILSVYPECLLEDGLDSFRLQAVVSDRHGHAVRDGTQVIIEWGDGIAFGSTVNGIATISLPPINDIGHYQFSAYAGNTDDIATLQIVETECP